MSFRVEQFQALSRPLVCSFAAFWWEWSWENLFCSAAGCLMLALGIHKCLPDFLLPSGHRPHPQDKRSLQQPVVSPWDACLLALGFKVWRFMPGIYRFTTLSKNQRLLINRFWVEQSQTLTHEGHVPMPFSNIKPLLDLTKIKNHTSFPALRMLKLVSISALLKLNWKVCVICPPYVF